MCLLVLSVFILYVMIVCYIGVENIVTREDVPQVTEKIKIIDFLIFIMLYFAKYVKFKIPKKRKYVFNDSTRLFFNYVMFYIKVLCNSYMIDFVGYYTNYCINKHILIIFILYSKCVYMMCIK